MSIQLTKIVISYNSYSLKGRFIKPDSRDLSVWLRLRQSAMASTMYYELRDNYIELPWPNILNLVREFAPLQKQLNFFFSPDDSAKEKVEKFANDLRSVGRARNTLNIRLSIQDIDSLLFKKGFVKRKLKDFQKNNVQHLLNISNGANFSVPGAGKTTVSFAIHLLTRQSDQHLLVVGPKSALMAWQEVIEDCMDASAPHNGAEAFTVLGYGYVAIQRSLESGSTRFFITYDQLIRVHDLIENYLSRYSVHMILDESHRMKAGLLSQRGSVLLNLAPLPIRRDILSGTPMPQSPSDLQSQLDFLWPGTGLGRQIDQGISPRDVLGNLFVRTTKSELGLRKPNRNYYAIEMNRGQLALYSILRDEVLSQLSSFRQDRRIDISKARRSVMRLLQVSTNPALAISSISEGIPFETEPALLQLIVEEGPSLKMRAVADLARRLALQGKKTVIWTIFTDTLLKLEGMLADLNPVTIYGNIPTGDTDDLECREGRIHRFHVDNSCWVLIANPAAASEGISLHHVCHDAIYLDRSYNVTHYLQSIDRIHRLGLSPETETDIHIFQTKAPAGLGSIDHSVSRRLAKKVRAMQALLDDPDLHELAYDEENAELPIDFDIRLEDLEDLINEIENRSSYTESDLE